MNVGFNPSATVGPGGGLTLYWYAGTLSFDRDNKLVQTPVELGSVPPVPADPLIQHRKGLIGALVVEPKARPGHTLRGNSTMCPSTNMCIIQMVRSPGSTSIRGGREPSRRSRGKTGRIPRTGGRHAV